MGLPEILLIIRSPIVYVQVFIAIHAITFPSKLFLQFRKYKYFYNLTKFGYVYRHPSSVFTFFEKKFLML